MWLDYHNAATAPIINYQDRTAKGGEERVEKGKHDFQGGTLKDVSEAD